MQDNQAFRTLFILPPVQASTSTALAIPEMPAPKKVTGDREVDTVLWLQHCIRFGHLDLIARALDAVKQVTTPMKDLRERYIQHLTRDIGGQPKLSIYDWDLSELERQAQSGIEQGNTQIQALSRFGTLEALLSDTAAEAACKEALQGAKRVKGMVALNDYEPQQVAARFAKTAALQPNTMMDCLHGLAYWRDLYWLRAAFPDSGDGPPYAHAHDDHCFALLAELPPRSKEEALQVLAYLEDEDVMDREQAPDILRNLISGGWA